MDWRTDAPGWQDSGPIEMRLPDGSVVFGDMTLDVGFDGESEVPVPCIDIGNGIKFDFTNAEAWRRIEAGLPEA
ncbi:MAG: hypothetical protein AB7S70_06915 [Hyphomicrobium sp.]|uniref:hypothetical protein n=1 Tax=Hyphomicrobium sp. TaxID=82 RepID=UPI003D0F8DA4